MSFSANQVDRVALSGFALLTALVVTDSLPWGGKVAAGVVLLALAVGAALIGAKRRKAVWALVTLALFCAAAGLGLLCLRTYREAAVQASLPEQATVIEGTVSDLPTYDGRFCYPITVTALDGKSTDAFTVQLISRKDLDGDLGDRFVGTVTLKARDGTGDAIATAYRTVDGTVSFTAQESDGLKMALCRFRRRLLTALDTAFDGDIADIAKAVLLGDTSGLSDSLTEAFRNCGVSHTIVISGMHMSTVAGLFTLLLRAFYGWRRRLAAALSLLPVLAFLALCGMAPSAVRAGVATLILLVGLLFDESVNGYTALGWSIPVLAILDPKSLTTPGFLFSVTAVVGLFGFGIRWHERHKDVYWHRHRREMPAPLRTVSVLACGTLAAQVVTLPLSVLYFDRVSLMGLPVNLAISWAVDVMLICGVLMLLAMSIGLTPLGYVLGVPTGLAARYLSAVVRTCGNWPGITLPVWGRAVVLCTFIGATALLIAVVRGRWRMGVAAWLGTMILCVACVVPTWGATRVLITSSGCYVYDNGTLCAIGFDDADTAVSDAGKAMRLFAQDHFDTVVWPRAADWVSVLKSFRVETVITAEPTAGALPVERQGQIPAQVTVDTVTYECRETYTRISVRGGTVVVANEPTTPDSLPEADVWVIPVRDADGRLTPTVTQKADLAKSDRTVYNEEAKSYVLTVAKTGHTRIETR